MNRSQSSRGTILHLVCAPSVLPEPIEAVGAQFGIADRVHDVAVAEEVLQRASIDAVVGELEAAGMAQHVRMNGERKFGQFACPADLSFPKIPSRPDSRDEAESAHHTTRCLHFFSCLGRVSPTCSGRSAGLKSRTSFSGISSILL